MHKRTVRQLPYQEKQHSLWGLTMIWTLAVILFVLWLLGGFVFHVGGGLIHILLVIAVIVVLYRLITGRRPIA